MGRPLISKTTRHDYFDSTAAVGVSPVVRKGDDGKLLCFKKGYYRCDTLDDVRALHRFKIKGLDDHITLYNRKLILEAL